MSTPRRSRPSRSWLILLVGGTLGVLLGLALSPAPTPPAPTTGDPALARDAAVALAPTEGYQAISVVRIHAGEATWAGFGDVAPDSRFELGSITKTFDGLLLADAVQRGEVRLEDRLDSHLSELAGSQVGSVTLEELASHRAGLPSLSRANWIEIVAEDLAGTDVSSYREATAESIVAEAADLGLSGRGKMQYSNLGASLLGHALARAAGAPDWPAYVDQRLFEPLGMDATQVAAAGEPAPDLMQPHRPSGQPVAAWTGAGYAPAGVGVTTTAADLTTYAKAILDGTAPGLAALEARWPAIYGQQIGLAWMVADGDGHPVVWHNGGTGGSRTMLAIDRERGTAALVLTNSSRDVTGAGLALVGGVEGLPSAPPIDMDSVPWVLVGLLTVLLFAVGSVRGRSRARVLGQGLGAGGALLLWWVAAPWDWAPAWTFGLTAGLVVAAGVVAGRRWAGLPWWPARRRPFAVMALALGSVWLLAMVALATWVATLRP